MSALKRNIIMSNKASKNNEMAVLTIEKHANAFDACIKLYNIENKDLMLAISCDSEQVFKSELPENNYSYNFKLSSGFNMNSQISCVVVKKQGSNVEPIVWDTVFGLENKAEQKAESMFALSSPKHETVKKPDQSFAHATYQPNKPNELFGNKSAQAAESAKKEQVNLEELFDILDEELEREIDITLQKNNTDHANKVFDEETEKLKEQLSENVMFFELINDQIEDLFSKYPSESSLETLIPNSKWVKVDFEEDANPYVLGLIYDDVILKYIAYGVPGEFSKEPPADLEKYSQWLPIDPNNIEVGGYWVMYQDAATGDNVLIEYV